MKNAKEFFDSVASTRDYWKKRNWYYYKKTEDYHKALVPEGLRVLEIGSGAGFLPEFVPEAITSDVLPCPGARLGLDAYAFVLTEDDFWTAFGTPVAIAAGMTAIAVPLGAVLAFLMVRTDVPAKGVLEPLLLVPIKDS